jgi:hypothetical protein
VVSTSERALDDLLCVHAVNTEAKGAFIGDPGFPGSTVFVQEAGKKLFSYTQGPESLEAGPDTVYDAGRSVGSLGGRAHGS